MYYETEFDYMTPQYFHYYGKKLQALIFDK